MVVLKKGPGGGLKKRIQLMYSPVQKETTKKLKWLTTKSKVPDNI